MLPPLSVLRFVVSAQSHSTLFMVNQWNLAINSSRVPLSSDLGDQPKKFFKGCGPCHCNEAAWKKPNTDPTLDQYCHTHNLVDVVFVQLRSCKSEHITPPPLPARTQIFKSFSTTHIAASQAVSLAMGLCIKKDDPLSCLGTYSQGIAPLPSCGPACALLVATHA